MFRPSLRTTFKVLGSMAGQSPQVVSALKEKKLINQTAWGLVASVLDSRCTGVIVPFVPVVREFANVFLEDIPSLSLALEVDFTLELKSRTTPISKSPCRPNRVRAKVIDTKTIRQRLYTLWYLAMGTPVLIVKKDGSMRLIIGYCALNTVQLPFQWPPLKS